MPTFTEAARDSGEYVSAARPGRVAPAVAPEVAPEVAPGTFAQAAMHMQNVNAMDAVAFIRYGFRI